MCDIVDFRILRHFLPLDGNLRVSRCWASVHWVLEWDNHRPYRILCFQAATSCRLSSILRCSFLLSICQDAISHVMYSPMSFFETTVRTTCQWLTVFLLPLNHISSRLAVL
jgi:hypothetical protein